MKHACLLAALTLGLLAAACAGSSSEHCSLDGCPAGFHCNRSSDACEADCTAASCAAYGAICDQSSGICLPDCTVSGCDISRNLVCDPQIRMCIEGCRFGACPTGSHCDLDTDLCADDCTADTCPQGTICSATSLDCEASISFSDAGLDRCIRETLGQETLIPSDLQGVLSLECQDMAIADLSGIELLVDLEDLSLYENAIRDLGPLAGLRKLRTLQLGANAIADLSALAGLPALRRLGLFSNQIADLSPLATVGSLTSLNVDDNLLADASPLVGLKNLNWLTIEHNPLGDLAPLTALQATGCEVYAGLSVGRSARRSGALPSLRADLPAGFAGPRPALDIRIDDQGRVSFWFDDGTRAIQARPEFAGDIVLEGEDLVYRPGPVPLVLGGWTGTDYALCSDIWAEVCSLALGVKDNAGELHPAARTREPVYTVSLTVPAGETPTVRGHVDRVHRLDPFVLASPNQFDAGSCVFMANTGAMEILMNQHTPVEDIAYDGDTDLSERFLMNGLDYLPDEDYNYFIIDLQYIYNHLGGSLLSRDYPFTANYVKENFAGNMVPCDADDPDGYLSCYYNWFDFLPTGWRDMLVATPSAERTMIFLDPDLDESSIWNVALMNDDVIERIKFELRTRNAPVIIVYNHFLYWHSDIIVGYDENESVGECPMVKQSLDYYAEKGYDSYVSKIEAHMAAEGGCASRGVFYVRDSIYDGGLDEPWYDYSNEDVQVTKERYSKRIITRSTDWVKYLANHAYTVHRD